MGVIIHDEITLSSGLKVTDAYAGFATNSILVTPIPSDASPTGKVYNVQAPFFIWVSDATRKAGNDPLMTKALSFEVGPEALTKGVYGVLYSKMCEGYRNCTNTDLAPATPAAADAAPPQEADSAAAGPDGSAGAGPEAETSTDGKTEDAPPTAEPTDADATPSDGTAAGSSS